MEEIISDLKYTHEFWVFLLPVIIMVFDVITGYYNAWRKNEQKSSIMRDGLGKKIAELCYIAVPFFIGLAFNKTKFSYPFSFYVIYMEVLSIIENCKKLGVEPPEELKEKINNKGSEE